MYEDFFKNIFIFFTIFLIQFIYNSFLILNSLDGNEDGLFGIKRLENNSALINITGRIDRESNGEHLITVKCFKFSATPQSLRKMYNKQVSCLLIN